MKVNRRLLYWGVFFLSLGAVLLAASAAAIDDEVIAQALRYWPIAVIGTPIPVDTWAIVEGERTLTGSVQHHFDEDLPIAVDLLASGLVDVRPLITRRIALDRVVTDGFAALGTGGADIKVLVSTRLS